MAKDKRSDAIKLLDLVWENANKATDHSWERLNHAMQNALTLVIGSGFEFALDDLKTIAGKYNFGRWSSDSVEWIYGLAVAVENASVIKAFEAWQLREPFIADDVRLSARGGFTHGDCARRARERLTVGAEFQWKGVKVKVTSFGDGYVMACSYRRIDGESEKINKRFKITRDDIIADRAERKERESLLSRLTAACQGSTEVATTITKALGTKTAEQFATIPIAKVRAIADQYAPALSPDLLITKAHHKAARAAGCCAPSLKNYPVGAPLSSLDQEARAWIKVHLPELYAKHFGKTEAA